MDTNEKSTMKLKPSAWLHLNSRKQYPLSPLPWRDAEEVVTAVAGIGNPERFFNTLKHLNINASTIAFNDHYEFTEDDFKHIDGAVVMTEKDAIKCTGIVSDNTWALQVEALLPTALIKDLTTLVSKG